MRRSPLRHCVVLVLLAAACSTPEPKAPPLPPITPIMMPPALTAPSAEAIAGRVWGWQRTEFRDGRRIAADTPERYTLEFLADGRVQLRADCNRGSAGYTLGTNRALSLTPAATTKAGCPPGSKDAEFLRELAEVGSYMQSNGDLVLLLKTESGSMRFSPLAR